MLLPLPLPRAVRMHIPTVPASPPGLVPMPPVVPVTLVIPASVTCKQATGKTSVTESKRKPGPTMFYCTGVTGALHVQAFEQWTCGGLQ